MAMERENKDVSYCSCECVGMVSLGMCSEEVLVECFFSVVVYGCEGTCEGGRDEFAV